MAATQKTLKKIFDSNNPEKPASTPQQQLQQNPKSQPAQQKIVKQKTKQTEHSNTKQTDSKKQTKPLKAF